MADKYIPDYNDEEKKLIEGIHSSFPKVELDPNVAIGQVLFEKSHFVYCTSEEEELEAFFRGITWNEIRDLGDRDNSFFYPAKHKPIPWWKVELDGMAGKFLFGDIMFMSPYGKYYYLPYFMLVQILNLNVLRCGQDRRNLGVGGELWSSLIEPGEKDWWKESELVPSEYKNFLNKRELVGELDKSGGFPVFLSFFNEAQKRSVTNLLRYGTKISLDFNHVYNFDQGIYFKDKNDMINCLKRCWSL